MPPRQGRPCAGVDPVFDDALRRLVAAMGATIVAARPITTLPGRASARATCRLRLSDGREVKGRRVESAEDAERIERLVRAWRTRHLPTPLARRDRVLIEPWVSGQPLTALPPKASRVEACGRLLGRLHVMGAHVEPLGAILASRMNRARGVIGQLTGDGSLTRAAARRLIELAERYAPRTCQTGIIHGDFCPENIIVSGQRALRVIDCETIAIDAIDYDLARATYRWPLHGDAESHFLAGYGRARDPGAFLRHRPFWMVCALADAALFRSAARTPNARVPLDRLLGLLEPERGRRGSSIRMSA